MNKLIHVYKPIGMTPLELIRLLKETYPEYANVKIGYAGRLDPLAHGVMLLMVGDATKQRDLYLHLPKEYTFEAVFGFKTDTYDMLGLPQQTNAHLSYENANSIVNSFAKDVIRTFQQAYPPFSSKTVQGKPLFWWAKQNKLAEITIPAREVEVTDFKVSKLGRITGRELLLKIENNIALVQGDFRQVQIGEQWNRLLSENLTKEYIATTCSVHCSSGTYIRSLAHTMGLQAGVGAIALDIKRTAVGKYTLERALDLRGAVS